MARLRSTSVRCHDELQLEQELVEAPSSGAERILTEPKTGIVSEADLDLNLFLWWLKGEGVADRPFRRDRFHGRHKDTEKTWPPGRMSKERRDERTNEPLTAPVRCQGLACSDLEDGFFSPERRVALQSTDNLYPFLRCPEPTG